MYLFDQTAFTVTNAQGKSAVRLHGGPVSRVREHFVVVGHVFKGQIAFLLRFDEHVVQQVFEVIQVFLFHIVPPVSYRRLETILKIFLAASHAFVRQAPGQ